MSSKKMMKSVFVYALSAMALGFVLLTSTSLGNSMMGKPIRLDTKRDG